MILSDKARFVELLIPILSTSKNICIISHANPDGDAIGSSLGLFHVLSNNERRVNVLMPDRLPEFLRWLPGGADVVIGYDQKAQAAKVLAEADLVICLDFNQLNRVNGLEEGLTKTTAKRILIDHHPEPDDVFALGLSVTSSSSTSELVYDVAEGLGLTTNLSKEAATCIYTGIMTDTGSFSYGIASGRPFAVLAHLMDAGAEKERIHAAVYDSFSEGRMRLMGLCLKDKMVVLPKLRTAYISLTAAEIKQYSNRIGDTEGFVNLPLSIEGIVFTVLFVEREDQIKLSLRSRGNFAANEFAKKHFSGGGHRNAAGGKSTKTLMETIAEFEKLLEGYEKELRNA
ncbi:MAG TPA: bifunctional oligoribonuclease/PAP phosphatase NrnA [Williamwhitmania sp.]|nr:bifunctional oligoribonuclease/PAP phosphatase NrnA [Williamwhitmania sp.]